ncbi:MAG TPA: hypothetical protein GX747_03740 [Tenericutes bacterium]|nr:hypothetical protein [Mycoplasmatota bacterium]
MKTQKKINKKIAKQKDVTKNVESNEVKRLGILVAIVTGIFVIFYGITVLVMRENETYDYIKKISTAKQVQYDEIIISQLFNQKPTEYYVFIKENEDLDNKLYDVYIENYKDSNKDGLNIYTINIDKLFNSKNKSDESNFKSANIDEIKVKKATILKIANKQISEVYEGKEEIINFFNEKIVKE